MNVLDHVAQTCKLQLQDKLDREFLADFNPSPFIDPTIGSAIDRYGTVDWTYNDLLLVPGNIHTASTPRDFGIVPEPPDNLLWAYNSADIATTPKVKDWAFAEVTGFAVVNTPAVLIHPAVRLAQDFDPTTRLARILYTHRA